jgi:hypothetical protein
LSACYLITKNQLSDSLLQLGASSRNELDAPVVASVQGLGSRTMRVPVAAPMGPGAAFLPGMPLKTRLIVSFLRRGNSPSSALLFAQKSRNSDAI